MSKKCFNAITTNLYCLTVDYLKELGVSSKKLSPYLKHHTQKITTKNDLLQAMIDHLKNRNQMANVIGDIAPLKKPLFNFNPVRVLKEYQTPQELLESFANYSDNAKKALRNDRKLWPLFCEGIFDICNFIQSFKNFNEIDDLFKFYKKSSSLYVKKSLPLLLAKEIKGYGFALGCDFCKEYISSDYVKPDVHIMKVLYAVNLIDSDKNELQAFNKLVELAQVHKVTPYALDKVIWLSCSGRLYQDDETISTNRDQYIHFLKTKI